MELLQKLLSLILTLGSAPKEIGSLQEALQFLDDQLEVTWDVPDDFAQSLHWYAEDGEDLSVTIYPRNFEAEVLLVVSHGKFQHHYQVGFLVQECGWESSGNEMCWDILRTDEEFALLRQLLEKLGLKIPQ